MENGTVTVVIDARREHSSTVARFAPDAHARMDRPSPMSVVVAGLALMLIVGRIPKTVPVA